MCKWGGYFKYTRTHTHVFWLTKQQIFLGILKESFTKLNCKINCYMTYRRSFFICLRFTVKSKHIKIDKPDNLFEIFISVGHLKKTQNVFTEDADHFTKMWKEEEEKTRLLQTTYVLKKQTLIVLFWQSLYASENLKLTVKQKRKKKQDRITTVRTEQRKHLLKHFSSEQITFK